MDKLDWFEQAISRFEGVTSAMTKVEKDIIVLEKRQVWCGVSPTTSISSR